MTQLEIKCEPRKERLHKISDIPAGDVCIDTTFGEVMLVVSKSAILSEAVDNFLEREHPDLYFPPFDRLDNCVVAASLASGELHKYAPPYRKVFKKVKSARMYVKE